MQFDSTEPYPDPPKTLAIAASGFAINDPSADGRPTKVSKPHGYAQPTSIGSDDSPHSTEVKSLPKYGTR